MSFFPYINWFAWCCSSTGSIPKYRTKHHWVVENPTGTKSHNIRQHDAIKKLTPAMMVWFRWFSSSFWRPVSFGVCNLREWRTIPPLKSPHWHRWKKEVPSGKRTNDIGKSLCSIGKWPLHSWWMSQFVFVFGGSKPSLPAWFRSTGHWPYNPVHFFVIWDRNSWKVVRDTRLKSSIDSKMAIFKGVTFFKRSFWVSMLVFGDVLDSKNSISSRHT